MTVARFNRRATNLVTRRFAGKLPGFAIVEHRGRRSGTTYRTPVNLFHDGETLLIALTYGPDADWVRNTRAAGGCTVIERGKRIPTSYLTIEQGPDAIAPLPWLVRAVLTLISVDQVLRLKPTPPARALERTHP
jgi:deazaflavin-dependent oxidoreductase (nitroreductase family)